MKQLIALLLILPWLVNPVFADSKTGTITKREWLAYKINMPAGQVTLDYTLMWKNKDTLAIGLASCTDEEVPFGSSDGWADDVVFNGGNLGYTFGDGTTKVINQQLSAYGDNKVCLIFVTAWWGPSSAFVLSADIMADAGLGGGTAVPKAELVPHLLTDEESQALTDRLLGN